ncbi:MAG: rhodanese-like domain-containing protein [Deltaproteobacteria bacterium]|nr:rhodanese-like domain-containing protein [Deltaproteobacteria bacterium]
MIKNLSIEELFAKSKALTPEDLILDVRTPQEFAEGHIPGSRNIMHSEVGLHAAELKKFKNVFVYCHAGGRVQMACHELFQHGLMNLSGVMHGGMPDWEAQGYPVEK